MTDHEQERPLEPEIRARLRARFGTVRPADELEERTLAALHREGLLTAAFPGRVSLPRALGALAAGALLFVAGIWAGGGFESTPAPAADGLYLMLLRESPGAPLAATEAGEEALVQEYSEWAGEHARTGRLVLGEKLAGEGWLLDGATVRPFTADDGTVVTGLFLLRADDRATALEIARSTPHLRHGGVVELRPVEPTG